MTNKYILSIIVPVSGLLVQTNAQATRPTFGSKSQCEVRYSDLKDQCGDLQRRLENALSEIERLRDENQSMKVSRTLKDPTWEAVRKLMAEDESGSRPYTKDKYNCEDFSLTLRDAARDKGFEAAYVSLRYHNEAIGHAIVAFDTLDHGLIYVEPQNDQIAYVQKGKPFGTIPVESVKQRYLGCPKNPSDLINSVNSEIYRGRMFDYAYFENYKARTACYDAALNAYNDAVNRFNRGLHGYTSRQLNAWLKNLNLLLDDLGSRRFTQDNEVVSNIMTHWR